MSSKLALQAWVNRSLKFSIEFQSPYGGRGRSDNVQGWCKWEDFVKFQSPCGGRGRSDNMNDISTYAPETVSITLRWQG